MLIIIQKRIVRGLLALCAALCVISVLPGEETYRAVSAATQAPRVLIIDPGHGGEDGGAVADDATAEAPLNLAVALRLEQLCYLAGVETAMTRREDRSLHTEGESIRARKASDIRNRTDFVNSFTNAALISIHQNALPQAKSVHGAQAFHAADGESEALAALIQRHLNACVNTDRAKAHRPIDPSVYLMKHAQCPAALIECGFLSNPEDTALLQTPSHQKKIALTAAAGYLVWCSGGEQELQ